MICAFSEALSLLPCSHIDHNHIQVPRVLVVWESWVNSCCYKKKDILTLGPRLPPYFRQSGNLGLGAQIATLSLQSGDLGPGDWSPAQGQGPNRRGPSRVEPAYLTCVQSNLTYKVPGIKFIVELTNCFGKFSTYGFAPGWTYPKFVIKIILTWIHFKQNRNYKTKQNI